MKNSNESKMMRIEMNQEKEIEMLTVAMKETNNHAHLQKIFSCLGRIPTEITDILGRTFPSISRY